eukprot:CAMPEP_0194171270 /NCGR_PEP_ID=MMETSP0154-20130528/5874_1 /TAXON_ID=1049557 /ORGANISM="Thalassiothrix antarctica, Strain L6-D1" /LENGTH=338 /DNA_ID=CAMNT_0038883497 /DNA_START=43 /DNA_END=1059 /DNA_ORIENTATION=-
MGQALSGTQFYVFGRKYFTRTGYEKNVKAYKQPVQSSAVIGINGEGADGVDLSGKVIVVTGANSGVGKEIATYAAAKGANLYMLCRSQGRAETARKEIEDITKNENIKVLLADVGELSQVRKVVEELQSKESHVDCLVCNAGVLLNERKETSEGNEVTFASHFLGGSYLLSKLLIPQLKASPDGRVVFVSSGGMLTTKFPTDLDVATSSGTQKEKYNGQLAYAYAKRGQVLLAERFTKDYPEIKFCSAHPGWSLTNAVEAAYGDSKKYLEPMRSPWQGAEGISWLMGTKNIESGEFYLDRRVFTKHVAGLFMSEGKFTKNTESDIDNMMSKLKDLTGL